MLDIKIGNKNIGAENSVYIIAEIGSNFDGDLRRAKYLAKLAKEVGADAYKIQNFLAPKMLSEKGFQNFQVSYQSKWDSGVFEVYRQAEFPRKWLKELSDYCRKIGIDFFSSPYDIEAVNLLEKIGVPAYKIGSGEIDNLEFLEYVARLGKPIILSCGTATLEEIGNAVSVIRDSGNNQIVLLQCVTNYPSPMADANIRAMVAIKEKFRVEVGYSDHTIGKEGGGDDPLSGTTVPLGAVALGARVIEKHFTDDRTRKGQDHPFAMDIEGFRKMVEGIRALEKALGNGMKRIMPSEKETAFIMRRGIYARKKIEKSQKISRDSVEFLRPATGLRPPQINEILDKVAKHKILAGEPITLDDVV
ncbi:N-acetylneuraminate synthase family protein [Patescibacteria group bacterium]|nr:N-acetylneuraminate synthase family protein [Patescibacteria group bacterium]